ncbi:MAG: signal peptide peptidase SppA [Pirellulales bacterium]|nr:signal peptide peptidase SppA [Pirellulales bacterium]
MDQPPQADGFSQQPFRPEVAAEPVHVQPRRKTSFFMRLVWAVLLLGLFGSLALNVLLFLVVGLLGAGSLHEGRHVREQYHSLNRQGMDKVAILSIEGTILSGEGFFRDQIEHAKRDIEKGNLKAIVVRVNSPGGTITGSDYMLHNLRKLAEKVPLVVSMGGTAASGGYYVSMCVGDTPNAIYAEPTTWTGSIGVLIPNYNFAELMERWGIQDNTISSGPMKTMGSFARKMTPEEKLIFQALVDDGFSRFKEVVKEGRPNFRGNPQALERAATGQIFTANQALTYGLIDRIGFVEDAIDRAISLAELDKQNVNVVEYEAQPTLSDMLFGGASARPSIDPAALLESATPRAYYLCTWLPALVRSDD